MSASSSNSHSNEAVEAESSRNPWESPYAESPGDEDHDGDLNKHISFKSGVRTSSGFLPSPLSTSRSPSPGYNDATNLSQRRVSSRSPVQPTTGNILSYLNTPAVAQDAKDPSALDWYVEGPGRRVGYDNLTAIDWIFEYAKERQRLRVLRSNAVGLLGYFQLLADNSQTWIILVATGIAVGAIAAAIDITSGWLGDLKAGYCSNVQDGGKFYLNRGFCCWGQKDFETCPDWQLWSHGMGVTSSAGSWIINFVLYLAYSVLFASVATYLVTRFSTYAKQSGIPEIKTVLGGFVIRRFMGVWTLVTKSTGLCLAVASGLWLGKEGPLVHVACCCANLFMKPFESVNSNEARKREVLSAASASGISVAFGAPVGGVLFSLESLSYYFPDKTMWQSFVCAMIAAFTLKAVDPFRTGKTVPYSVTYHTGWHGFEMVAYAIIGVLGGLYGGLLIKLNMRLAALRDSPRYPLRGRPILEVCIITIATSIIAFPVTFLRAQASELVYYLFAECKDIQSDPLGLCKSGIANTGVIFLLLISAIIGFFFTALTFGLQIPAGILLPSMTIGALYGRVIGLIVEVWQREHPKWIVFASCEPDVPCITPGTYAIVGAASALAGATRMTVSIVVIMFELTGALTYVLPIMIAVMIAKWVGDAMGKRGIYEAWIAFNEYPFLDNRDDRPIPDIPVSQIMTRTEDLVTINAEGNTIASLTNLLKEHTYRGFPVISNSHDAILLGYISRTELNFALNSAVSTRNLPPQTLCFFSHQPLADVEHTLDLRPWMDQTPITLNSAIGLELCVNYFQRLGLRYLGFCDRGVLKGLLTKKDVWFVVSGGNEGGGRVKGEREDEDAHRRVRGVGSGILREGDEGEERGLLFEGRGGREEDGDVGGGRRD
ncbi:hypothetical protein E4T42_03043 [Aureobasidium subglaciale]|nr:hypothetical protein E4T42_03043 [Aureobasidium subglaciale]